MRAISLSLHLSSSARYVVLGLSSSTALPDQVVQSIDSPMIVVGGNLLSYAPFSAARCVDATFNAKAWKPRNSQ
jgi:hypothetical protein